VNLVDPSGRNWLTSFLNAVGSMFWGGDEAMGAPANNLGSPEIPPLWTGPGDGGLDPGISEAQKRLINEKCRELFSHGVSTRSATASLSRQFVDEMIDSIQICRKPNGLLSAKRLYI
jgi:hypothetical protein